MTKQDYELLASSFKGTLETINKSTEIDDFVKSSMRGGVIIAINNVSNVLQVENARYEPDLFIKACGLKGT